MDVMHELDQATRRYKRTEKAHAEARDAAVHLVIAALRDGQGPTEVARRSPFTAAYVRRIAREHDIEPAKPGPKKRSE